MSTRKVYGVGINDAGYTIQKYINNCDGSKTLWRCPYYSAWKAMLQRCYCVKSKSRAKSYRDISVAEDWWVFSNFKSWCVFQEDTLGVSIKGLELDKDLLVTGNKVYSKSTCIFLTKKINNFLLDNQGRRGKHLIGVTYRGDAGKYAARCKNPFTNKDQHLGLFVTETEAHSAWVEKKLYWARILATSNYCSYDDRIGDNLVAIYENYTA